MCGHSPATLIRAFVAKNLGANGTAAYFPACVATTPATILRAFVAKNLGANGTAAYIPACVATAPATTEFK